MTLDTLLTQTVTVLHFDEGAKDSHGNREPSWDDGGEHLVRLEQTDATEVLVGRDTLVSDWRLYLHEDAVIGGRDRVVDEDGRTFEVMGSPEVQRSPRGPHHIVARLRYVDTWPPASS